jgi:hypothetical protein
MTRVGFIGLESLGAPMARRPESVAQFGVAIDTYAFAERLGVDRGALAEADA